jgi:hypothetical protein
MQTNVAVAFLDTRAHGFRGFEHYFRLAHKVPLSPNCVDLYVDRVVSIPDMSLTSLAAAMAENLKPGENALIYTHAEPNNFVFPVDPTQPKNDFDVKEAAALSYHLDLIEKGQQRSSVIDPFLHQPYAKYVSLAPKKYEQFATESPAAYLKIKDSVTAQMLQGDLRAIRQKGIGHLAVRACRIGQNPDFMQMLGRLFGAESVSAPKLRTASVLGGTQAFNLVKPENMAKYILDTKAKRNGVGGFHKYEFPSPVVAQNGVNIPYLFSFTAQKTGKTTFNLHTVKATFVDAIMEYLWTVAGYDALLGRDIAPYKTVALHALQGPHALIFPKERQYLQNIEFVRVAR